MLEGVRILIDRMETCPEDFVYDTNHLHVQKTPKFYYITDQINQILEGGTKYNMFSHLTAEEKTALIVAFRKMMRQAFTAQVIARTFEDKVEEEAPQLVPMRGYGQAVAKSPGAPVAYFGSHGTPITDGALINRQIEEKLINRQIEEKLREHVRAEAKRSEVLPWKL